MSIYSECLLAKFSLRGLRLSKTSQPVAKARRQQKATTKSRYRTPPTPLRTRSATIIEALPNVSIASFRALRALSKTLSPLATPRSSDHFSRILGIPRKGKVTHNNTLKTKQQQTLTIYGHRKHDGHAARPCLVPVPPIPPTRT
jgi:hypothetical protein